MRRVSPPALGLALALLSGHWPHGASASEPDATFNGQVMFADDFEDGFDDAWTQRGPGIEVVEEDGNAFARFTQNRQMLSSPPAIWGSPDSYTDDQLDEWESYDLSFRFRVVTANEPASLERDASLLRLMWAVAPVAENPAEGRQLYLQARLADMTFFGSGPRIPWYGKNERMAEEPTRTGIFETNTERPELDARWHTIRIEHRGETSRFFFDDELMHAGRDKRATAGGFAMRTEWNPDRLEVKHVDIDDVLAVKVER